VCQSRKSTASAGPTTATGQGRGGCGLGHRRRRVTLGVVGQRFDVELLSARPQPAAQRVDLAREVPLSRLPLDRLPFSFGAMPAEITDDLLVTGSGMDDY